MGSNNTKPQQMDYLNDRDLLKNFASKHKFPSGFEDKLKQKDFWENKLNFKKTEKVKNYDDLLTNDKIYLALKTLSKCFKNQEEETPIGDLDPKNCQKECAFVQNSKESLEDINNQKQQNLKIKGDADEIKNKKLDMNLSDNYLKFNNLNIDATYSKSLSELELEKTQSNKEKIDQQKLNSKNSIDIDVDKKDITDSENLNFEDVFSKEKNFNNFFFSQEDLGLAFDLSFVFINILINTDRLNCINNMADLKNLKSELNNQFRENHYLNSIFNSFMSLLKESFQNIYFKPNKNNLGEVKSFEGHKSISYSEINQDLLLNSLIEFEIIKHISNSKFSDYSYFKECFSLKKERIGKILFDSLEDTLENVDFFVLNDYFQKSIANNDYKRSTLYKIKIEDYFRKAQRNHKYNFSKENFNYEKSQFHKNETIFHKKFYDEENQMDSSNKNIKSAKVKTNINNLNPLERFRYYMIKSISSYLLNLKGISVRGEYLIDLSNAYLILKSENFENYLLSLEKSRNISETEYQYSLIKIKDKILYNTKIIRQLRESFYKTYETEFFENFSKNEYLENLFDKDMNDHNDIKYLLKIHIYFLQFGEDETCLVYIKKELDKMEEKRESSSYSILTKMKETIIFNLELKKNIYDKIKIQKSQINTYEFYKNNQNFNRGLNNENYNNHDPNSINFRHSDNNIHIQNNNNSNQDGNHNRNNQNNNNNSQGGNHNRYNINNSNDNNRNNNGNDRNDHNNPDGNPLDVPRNINMQLIRENPKIIQKVLSLDGGGIRGAFALYCLREIEVSLGRPIYEYFDFFAGTSIGGLISLCFAYRVYNAETLFREMVGIFKDNIFINTRCSRKWNKFSSAICFSKSIYREEVFEQILQRKLVDVFNGNQNEILKFNSNSKNFLITVCKPDIDNQILIPYCFAKIGREYGYYRITLEDNGNVIQFTKENLINIDSIKVWEIARATSAAYPYFKPKLISGIRLIDGGYQFNNPCFLALKYIKKYSLKPNPTPMEIKKFYKSIFILSIGLQDKSRMESDEFRWIQHEDRIDAFLYINSHISIVNESSILQLWWEKIEDKIQKSMNKLSNFSDIQTRRLIGNGFVRIDPDFEGGKHGLDEVSFTEMQSLLDFSEKTLQELERNQFEERDSLYNILREDYQRLIQEQNQNVNPNFNINRDSFINIISLKNISNLLFLLASNNNDLIQLNNYINENLRIRTNSCCRALTRYQKYPFSYSKISNLLSELDNSELTFEERIRKDKELLKILNTFDFRKASNEFYRNIPDEENKLHLPYYLFKSGIKEITYAISIGHFKLINYYKEKENLQLKNFKDYYSWSCYHTAIANDEIISFLTILREFIDIPLRANRNNEIIIDENDLTCEEVFEEDEIINEDINNQLIMICNDLENKKCGFIYSIIGKFGDNSKDFIQNYSSKKIKEFMKIFNDNLQRHGLDNFI